LDYPSALGLAFGEIDDLDRCVAVAVVVQALEHEIAAAVAERELVDSSTGNARRPFEGVATNAVIESMVPD
jgi:hypothetical protein